TEVIGLSIFELHPPKIAEKIKLLFLAFQTNPDYDLEIMHRELGERWLQMRFSAMRDKDGKFMGIIVNLIDETEIKKLAEKHHQLELKLLHEHKLSAIGILASGIAHNLNGPLTVIVGYLDLIYNRHPELKEIPLILSQAERMKEIIRGMMIKSRHEQDVQVKPINLNVLLQNELRFLEANLDFKHKVNKYYEFSEDLPVIQGVYCDFSQSLLNIVNNALDAMTDSPTKNLCVRTFRDNDNIYVEVEDTGCGLDEKDSHKLFNPFYSTKPAVGEGKPGQPTGTGLGLSSAHQLVSKYGGDIAVSGKVRVGAKFTVRIPIAKNQAPTESANVKETVGVKEVVEELVCY
ncbi:MAG: ATP-binding protein, partial [bacterium]